MTGQLPPQEPYERRHRDEKEEKGRDEKREKEEKGASDRLGSLTWGLILIFAGFVLLGVTSEQLAWLNWENAVSVILMGAGALVGAEVVVRLLMPEYRRPVGGRLVLAVILFIVGAGAFLGWRNVWPLILIGAGIAILIGTLTRR